MSHRLVNRLKASREAVTHGRFSQSKLAANELQHVQSGGNRCAGITVK